MKSATKQTIIAPYSFRPVDHADLAMLRLWLDTPAARRWWGDPETQAALLEGDLNDPRMTMRIVAFRGHPFAYAQDYAIASWPQQHFAPLPTGSRAIDTLIGEPGMLGVGHGSACLRLLVERLLAAGAPLVAIDPDPDNLRARRAYRRAGFTSEDRVEADDGPAILMTMTAGRR